MIRTTREARDVLCRIVFSCIFLITQAWSLDAQQVTYTPYLFTTIAGAASIGSADGANGAARFNGPRCAAMDASGNIYIADSDNNTIRSITRNGSNWIVATIAGVAGRSGFADGIGSEALFNSPEAIAVDKSGSIYVSDTQNEIIRKLTSNGSSWTVATIAGLPGGYGDQDGANQSAYFDDPEGLCIDPAGDIFVADYANNKIRKITHSTTNWIVTTIAGQGENPGHADGLNTNATFDYPHGIAIDGSGNLFVGDGFNYLIRKMTPSGTDWMTTTIAGQAGRTGGNDGLGTNAQFEFPTGIVADTNGNVFVADAEGYTIRELTPIGTNYSVSTPLGRYRLAGTTDGTNNNARFYGPYGVTMDNNGDLIIADTENSEIREAEASGTNWDVSTLAGFGANIGNIDGDGSTARFNQPFGIAVDNSSGSLFVVDNFNSTIRKITPNGSIWTTTTIAGQPGDAGFMDGSGTNALFVYPDGVAVDKSGAVYIADSGNSIIRQMTPSNGTYRVVTIAGTNTSYGSADGTDAGAQFENPSGIAVDSSSNLYIADCNNSTIRKIHPAGSDWVVTTIAGSAGVYDWADGSGTNALFNSPRGVAVDKNGVVYVTDWVNYVIRRLVFDGAKYNVTTIVGTPHFYGHSDGTNSDALFGYPTHIAVDNNGVLYVTDCNNSTVRKIVHIGANWVVTTLGGIPNQTGSSDGLGANALMNYSEGIAVDNAGVLYVTEVFNATIVKGVAAPVIVMNQPAYGSGQFHIPFVVQSGSPSTFELLQSPKIGSPWTTNGAALLSTITPGVSYSFTISLPAADYFFLIQTP